MSAGATLGIDGSVHLTSFAQTATKVGGAAFQTTYAGDANYASVAGPCHSIAVTAQLVPTITTAIHDASHAVVTNVAVGTTVHDSVTLAGAAGDPTPTGTITLEWFTSARCKGKASVTSSALALTGGTVDATAFPQTPLAAGAYSFQAVYSGDALFASRTGPCEALTVP
jgi:hypothetical protein